MGKFDKQLKYSIRKVSVGAASVVIGAFYLAMGAGVAHAETTTTTDGGASHSSPSPEPEPSRPNGLTSSNYGAEPARNPGVSGKPTESTTPKEKENKETLNAAQPTEASTSTNTRSRRVRREAGDAPAGGTSTGTETPTGPSTGNNETLNSAVTERKGATVQKDQPGINIPKGDEPGADDPNAHLSFNDPDHTVTVEEMWKIIQNMPDDFQNNERSYLRNMDTLGNALRFDKTETNPEGVPLQPGEIREISSFGGWTAIMKKDGTTGKFAVGMKNEQGYFTGWYTDKDGHRQEGGMLGSNALDQIYLHEQALDRRFKYMLMLAKGRTIANKEDKAQDGSTFNIVTANSAENKANLASLPVKDREDILQHAPNIEGFNGIEKTFTAFSTAYGSRLKIEFVTGYISDFEGSKGTYRIVVKAIKKDQTEETVYDHTINRIDGVVENEERYAQGVDLSRFNIIIKKFLKDEYNKKVTDLAKERYKKEHPGTRVPGVNQYAPLKPTIEKELAEKGEAIVELPIDKDKLQEGTGKLKNKFKEELNIQTGYATVANDLNNSFSKKLDREVQKNSPAWVTSVEKNPDGTVKSKDPDRVYKLLDFILPTAKKIIYHADTDQLELQTDPDKVTKHRAELNTRLADKKAELETANEEKKIELKKEISALESAIRSTNAYTYTEARNGSKEAKILGSFMKDKTKPDTSELSDADYAKYHTNDLAANESDGLSRFTHYFVEKENVTRSNVISDEKLSERITEEIGGDENKLGKGGYFSTGDIPLGKDVVSYKIQVFAENEKRVGVNMQSPRLQYNLPILADFSVIQDTVGPSKELARRIISKSNIPEEKKNKIIEEINKSKKTSEIKSQLSGDVKVKYQDVSGNVLTLDNTKEHQKETDLGKKGEDGTYLAVDSGLRYTNYDVTAKKLDTITTSDGKQYRLKRSSDDDTLDNGRLKASAAERGTLSDSLATVTFVYEEYTPPATGKGVVHFKKQVSETTTEALTGYDDITLEGNVGETFSSTEVDTKITALKNAGYEIVSNEFGTNSKTIDSTIDVDGQEPSQVYNVIVREKVETVTTPPTPNTPVDPNIPEGPKWPAEGLKESDLTKEVTRTINYFKKETADGEKIADAQPTKVDKVLYKRTATYNLVSKTVTYSGWTATADATHTATSFSPVKTPVLTGYVADFKEVTDAPAAPTANGEVTNMTREVVYTKLGSWVPKIPGKTPTPIPYPNDPKDPTKPKYPDYPTTPENPGETPNPQPDNPGGGNETPGGETPGTPEKPNTPVIPYVEGYVPKIPTDPTTPVGEDNPLKPLVPIDSNDPKKGYKVPELPNDPKKDTVIEYKPNPQKILIKVVNVTTGEEVELPNEKLEFNGVSDQVVTSEDKGKVDKKIDSLQKRGYIVSTKNPITETTKYDTKDDSNQKEPTQTYKIIVNEPVTKDTEVRKVTRTIKYVKIDVQDGNEVRTELNTEKIKTKVDKVEFSRDTTTSLATGLTKIGAWDQETKELPKVNTPVLVGYIANVVSVENKSVSPDTESYEVTVEYRKIGSWVPNLPEGVTPPAGTDMTPKPYPNNPTDPTKPKDPEYPQPGTPVEPNTPVIPYVPGYTPKIPTDPTQPVDPNTNPLVPLTPVDPNHPENGYKVPPVPTTPGNDTPITYEANPQKALVKVVKVDGTTETPLTEDNVAIAGKTGEKIPTGTVTAKIADLEKRGYVVDNKQEVLTAIGKNPFDTDKDTDGEDPTQTFTLKVHEKVVEVTEPPTPNTPIDPENPNGPKWTEELVNQLSLKKDVTRTITYVKKDTPNGEEIPNAKPTVTQTAHFKRNVKVNVATGTVVEYTAWTSTDNNLAAVTTEKLDGYVADKASVEGVETSVDSTDLDKKVVYTKLGSWVPNLPEGVTPPAGTDMTPKPYPNNPTNPTKPGTPVYPEPGQPITPGTPVIPYVPGYTPKIGETPLQPVDPNNPGNGYKVPPVPTEPGTNTDITYVADPQKAVVKVFNTTTGTEVELPAEKVSIDNGTTDAAIPTTDLNTKIADLEKRGYVVENKDLLKDQKFDKEKDPTDGDPTQVFKLLVKERTVEVTEPKNPNDPVDPDKPEGPKWPETGLAKSDLEKEVTRTITYVKKETADGPEIADAKPTVTQTAHFKRSATYNLVTKVVTPGEWTSTDKTLEAVPTEKLDGYVANVPSVEEVETNANSTNLDRKVVYTKLGSWVPKVPGVETPTPLPYPNHPTDPTKPGDPTDPNTPNVPVIPYVPGYTPKIGETPLQPKVPNDPTQGYIPPAVPTEPGTNTDITYVADPQKAVVKVFNTTTGTEVELPAEKVSIDNGTTDAAIPTDSVTAKIADLEKRGYVVENKDLLNNQKFDKEKDPTDGDPTQVFKLLVKERTVEVTEPKNPNDPVDPDKPEGPKWPETGLAKSDLEKEVTRTITYVKKETADGPEIADAKPTVTQTAHFKRSATYNAVTGTITYGNWESTDKELAKVDTPELTGYVADKASVDKVETNADSTGLDQKVVYTKLGSWVPNLPEGVTPPEGTDMTPKPYPNNPTDPTKPGTPVYPEPGQPITPGTPVIPYVPGYTPKIGDKPLEPVDPNNPESGYKVPPVPTTPGNDTPIEYSKDPQKAVVKVFNTTTGTEVELPEEKVELSGKTGEPIPTDSVTAKIAELEKRGYTVENKEPLKGETFDKNKDPENGDPTQVFKLLVKERTVTVTEPPTPNTPVDPNVPEGPKWPESGLKESDLKKEVTRTITYVKKEAANGPEIADAKPTVTQTAHFKRSATYNAVTGTITYGNWESTDKELAKVDTPALTGYVADKASVDKVETNADSTGLDQKVVYTKLGSWVPTPPAGVTPPEGTNFDPKPYPNNPTDPTRPKDPEYPQPGTPVEPNTPVIPYVPGYTPKTPDGNPLVPVDPNNPESGYKVPPVPTTPGNDTPITYEGNPQKVLVKVVKVDGTTETPLPKDNVTINGKTGDQIPTESVTAKIAELEKRGYVIDNRDEVVNYINNKFDKEKDTEGQDPTQNTTLKVHEKLVPVTPPTPEKPLEPGQPIDPDTPVDPNNPNDPTIPRWTDELIKKLDVKKEVTRTINYVDENGNKVSEPSTDKVTFTREAKINVVTGEITYGDWKAVGGDTTFDKVSSPVVKGYILKDPAQKEVAERKGITPTVANQTIEVVYKKLGSWVPKVPGVETPTPLPYPNDPTDPTKPGDPTDPNRPNVPVIPYVPGYTPKTPDGNPLVPVDPNHPEKGYKVPPVPTEPGKDTPIEYVKVPNTPSPEEPVKPTPESSHITIWVDENGKPLKPEKPGTHEPGNIPGYRFITTVTKDGVTIHKFEKITPVDPNNPVPQKPTTPIPTPQDSTIPTPESQIPTPNTPEANTPTSETNRREELPNTGTEANTGLAGAGLLTLLAGLGLGFFKKKEEDESE